MSSKTVVLRTCDRCGEHAPHFHTLRLDSGKVKALDLCDAHDSEMQASVQPWLDAGYVQR